MKQVICMKWGTLYGADYVNRLYSMVVRHLTGPIRFVCLTDDSEGIRPEVECQTCPEIEIPEPHCNRGWRKLTLWDHQIAGLVSGPALFLDLDIVILDNIDCLYEHPGDFVVCKNWTQAGDGIGNTSVYRFEVGSHAYLLQRLVEDQERILATYQNSQTYISRTIRKGSMTFWPDDWCRSFKVHCVPKGFRRWILPPNYPRGTRIVAFPGVPNPPDAIEGRWPSPWHKRFYKHIRPAHWVAEHWK